MIIEWLGRIAAEFLNFGYSAIPSWEAALFLFAAAAKLLTVPIGNKYYGTIKTVDSIMVKLRINQDSKAKTTETGDERKLRIFLENKYPILGGLGNFFAQSVFALGVYGAFAYGAQYLTNGGVNEFGLLSSADFAARPIYALLAGAADHITPFWLTLVVATFSILVLHDRLMRITELINHRTVHIAIYLLLLAGMVFLNLGFTVYWMLIELMNILHIVYMQKTKSRAKGEEK